MGVRWNDIWWGCERGSRFYKRKYFTLYLSLDDADSKAGCITIVSIWAVSAFRGWSFHSPNS